jgi:hypothetical protein
MSAEAVGRGGGGLPTAVAPLPLLRRRLCLLHLPRRGSGPLLHRLSSTERRQPLSPSARPPLSFPRGRGPCAPDRAALRRSSKEEAVADMALPRPSLARGGFSGDGSEAATSSSPTAPPSAMVHHEELRQIPYSPPTTSPSPFPSATDLGN